MHIKIRRIIYLLSLLATCKAAMAHQLDATEAWQRACTYISSSQKRVASSPLHIPNLTYTESIGGINTFYVWQNPGNGGYMIVSADDETQPILARIDEGTFSPDSLPPALSWLLSAYNVQIAQSKDIQTESQEKQLREEISPLIRAKWHQGSPFYDMCPMHDGSHTYAGCVAIALAQVMHHHQWPTQGKGNKSYWWNGQTISLDFSSMTYEWSNILNLYDSSTSDDNRRAVAELVYSCGVSVSMMYGTSSSSADPKDIAKAFLEYFDYDDSILYLQRSYFTQSQWEDVIYNELMAGRPVLYNGKTLDNEGHEFICDGYSDGLFHINWGWGGAHDGYFALNALNTDGETASNNGFNYRQGIVIGIQPPADETSPRLYMTTDGHFSTAKSSYATGSKVKFQSVIYMSPCPFYNSGLHESTVALGCRIIDSKGKITYIAETKDDAIYYRTIAPANGPKDFSLDLSGLEPGDYTFYPVFMDMNGDWHDILIMNGYSKSVSATISSTEMVFERIADSAKIQASEIILDSPVYLDKRFRLKAKLGAETETTASVKAGFFEPGSRNASFWTDEAILTVYADHASGQTTTADGAMTASGEYFKLNGDTLEMVATIKHHNQLKGEPVAGEYELALIDNYYHDISPRVTVQVKAAPATTIIRLDSLYLASGKVAPWDNVNVKASIVCDEGYFDGVLTFKAFLGGKVISSFISPMIFIECGEKNRIDFKLDIPRPKEGMEYTLQAYVGDTPLGESFAFTLTDPEGDFIPSGHTEIGDVNDDGHINVSDVVIAIDYILGNNPKKFVFDATDINHDGVVNVTDIVLIIDLILNN